MYEAILHDAYKKWLEEFDHEAAFRRNLPRREWRFRSPLRALRGRAQRPEAAAGPLHRVADAQQCAR